MAQIHYRANLSSVAFPFLVEKAGRSVINRGPDHNYVNPITSEKDLDKDIGIPQVIYCHNVLPTEEGYTSIDYNQVVSAASASLAANESFVETVSLQSDSGQIVYIARTSAGQLFYYRAPNLTWTLLSEIPGITGKGLSVARVAGISYLYIANTGCYTFNFTTNVLESVTLAGLDMAAVLGILNSQGYMIAYTASAVAWSSLVDPLDFEPSLATGAGGGALEQLRGAVVTCLYTVTGFIVYSSVNAVVALYSGNDRYPFNFREISFSGGLIEVAGVTRESNAGFHYAYTTSGLQQIAPQETKSIFPALTDFLSAKTYDSFNSSTLELTKTRLASALLKSLAIVADRYLIISYGYPNLDFSIVYDIVLERFGKLKMQHVQAFEWWGHEIADTDRVKTSLAYLHADGTIVTANFSQSLGSYGMNPADKATFILGKLQYARSRLLTLHEVQVENVHPNTVFSLYDIPALDGKTWQTPVAGIENTVRNPAKNFFFRQTAENHSICCIGKFDLNTVVAVFTAAGRR